MNDLNILIANQENPILKLFLGPLIVQPSSWRLNKCLRTQQISHSYLQVTLSQRFKKFKKIRLRSISWRWALFTAWASGFEFHLIFHSIEFLKLVKCWIWRILMVGIGAFLVLIRTRLNIGPYSPIKPTKVGFFSLWLTT